MQQFQIYSIYSTACQKYQETVRKSHIYFRNKSQNRHNRGDTLASEDYKDMGKYAESKWKEQSDKAFYRLS